LSVKLFESKKNSEKERAIEKTVTNYSILLTPKIQTSKQGKKERKERKKERKKERTFNIDKWLLERKTADVK
jgi:hypothetical protein